MTPKYITLAENYLDLQQSWPNRLRKSCLPYPSLRKRIQIEGLYQERANTKATSFQKDLCAWHGKHLRGKKTFAFLISLGMSSPSWKPMPFSVAQDGI